MISEATRQKFYLKKFVGKTKKDFWLGSGVRQVLK